MNVNIQVVRHLSLTKFTHMTLTTALVDIKPAYNFYKLINICEILISYLFNVPVAINIFRM